jgi:hypothetical protein
VLPRTTTRRSWLGPSAEHGDPAPQGLLEERGIEEGNRLTAILVAAPRIVDASGLRTPEELSHHLAFLQLELGDEEFRAATLQHTDAMVREIAGLLQAAMTAGELAACDTRQLARAVHVTYNEALITWAIMRTGDIDRFLHDELEFLLERYRLSPAAMRAARKVKGARVSTTTQPGSTNTSPAPS